MNPVFQVIGVKEFVQGIENAQKLKYRYMRSEANRGAKRVRKYFIREDLSGRPGIEGGQFKKGKQVFTFISTRQGGDITANVGISKGLRVHEEGHVFRPTTGDWLFIHSKKAGGKIVAKVREITIPKRTNFRVRVREMAPEVLRKIAAAGARAVEQSMTKSLNRTIGAL